MSLIMDALRKSERQRQRSLAGQLSSLSPSPHARRQKAPWGLIIGLLLVLNAVLGLALLWRQDHQRVAVTTQAVSTMPTPAETRPEVRSLAAEAAAGAIDDNTQAPTPTASQQDQGRTAGMQSTPTAAADTASADTDDADVLPLDALPDSFRQSLPTLHLDVHSYSAQPAQRFVLINMHRYQEGDVLREGPRVVKITPEGVILAYHGQRFLLPRQ